MPAGENVELARRLYDSFIRRDFAGAVEFLDPEIELLPPKGTLEEGSYRGYEQVRAHLAGLMDPFEDVRIQPEDFIEAGDQVVAIVHVSGRGRGSGLPIDTTFAHLLTVRDGKVVRFQAFFDREEALEAAGVR
jgi:ketosteroid isomerase-like protein